MAKVIVNSISKRKHVAALMVVFISCSDVISSAACSGVMVLVWLN